MRGWVFLCSLLLALLTAVGCSGGGGGGGTGGTGAVGGTGGTGGKPHSNTGNSWTLLVYMVADNDLEPFAIQDLEEMLAVGSTPQFNLIVQSDRAAGFTGAGVGNLGNWESTKRLKIEAGGITELADIGEVNMGDPQALADFVAWGASNFPADRVGVVFWDHGGAWPGFGGDYSTPNTDLLNLGEIASGLSQGMNAAGLGQLAFIGFDACLMATFETAMTVRPFGEYLLASEELEPGHGWDYRSLALLRDNPAASPVDLGKTLMSGFRAQAEQSGTAANITLSLVDLYALDPLVAAVAGVASTMNGDLLGFASTIGTEQTRALAFGKFPDESKSTHMVDLGDLVNRIGAAQPALAGPRDQLNAALAQAVVAREAGPATSSATGIAIYFPRLASFYDPSYDALVLAEIDPWRGFLKSYYGTSSQVGQGPVFLNPDHLADYQYIDNSLYVSGQLDPATAGGVTLAYLSYGISDAATQSIVLTGSQQAGMDANAVVTGSWDGSLLTLTQGDNVGYGYLDVTAVGNLVSLVIPFLYEPYPGAAAEYVILEYTVDANTGDVLQGTYYVVTDAGVGELTPEPGSTLTPLLLVVDAQGVSWGSGSDLPYDASQEIVLDFAYVPTGTEVYLDLTAEDAAGRSDYVYVTGAW